MDRAQQMEELDSLLGGDGIAEFNSEISDRLTTIYALPLEEQNDAYDALIGDLPDLMSDLDVFDRVTAGNISGALKRIYDQDASRLANYPKDELPMEAMKTSRRAIELMEMRKRVNEANRRFGILQLSTRKYIGPLVHSAVEAEKMLLDDGLSSDEYRVQEHYGEGWEAFLQLNVSEDLWQDYSKAYHDQIMSKIVELKRLPFGRTQKPTETTETVDETDEDDEPVARPVVQQPIAPPATLNISGSGTVQILDTSTGLQSRVSVSDLVGDTILASNDVRTGDRDDRRRSLTVPANLNGLATWVGSTYRTYGDTVTTVESPQGGVISLTITGDTDLWQRRTTMMRIPAPLTIVADPTSRSVTISYA